MKTFGRIRYGETSVRYDLRATDKPDRYEIRLTLGEVEDFMFGWIVVRCDLVCVTLSPALGFTALSYGPTDEGRTPEQWIEYAVGKWQALLAIKSERSRAC